jgi:hypothetical protein
MDQSVDAILGKEVTIRSVAGIDYHGIVRTILADRVHGELFELGRDNDRSYQRFVYVLDRERQIRPFGDREAGMTT